MSLNNFSSVYLHSTYRQVELLQNWTEVFCSKSWFLFISVKCLWACTVLWRFHFVDPLVILYHSLITNLMKRYSDKDKWNTSRLSAHFKLHSEIPSRVKHAEHVELVWGVLEVGVEMHWTTQEEHVCYEVVVKCTEPVEENIFGCHVLISLSLMMCTQWRRNTLNDPSRTCLLRWFWRRWWSVRIELSKQNIIKCRVLILLQLVMYEGGLKSFWPNKDTRLFSEIFFNIVSL